MLCFGFHLLHVALDTIVVVIALKNMHLSIKTD